jgi:hypothetical protein
MHLSRKSVSFGFIAVACVVASVNCGTPGECLRYSDCDQGLTCARGHCVPPPSSDDAGEDAETDAAEAAADASAIESGTPGTVAESGTTDDTGAATPDSASEPEGGSDAATEGSAPTDATAADAGESG